jgi:hypothetical protein
MKIIRRLQELSHPEALRLCCWSLLTTLLAAGLLRTISLPALLHRFARPSRSPISQHASLQSDTRRMQAVWRYSHTIVTALLRSQRPCLLRSLVVYRYGCKHGIPVSIHFGVRPGMDGLEGHSWVTLHGTPLCESDEVLRSYTSVYSYPESSQGVGRYQPLTTVGWQP